MTSPVPARRSTLKEAVAPDANRVTASSISAQPTRAPRQQIGQDFEADCPNAKVIRLEHGRAFSRLRAKLGMSREDAASATASSAKAVRMWEDGESTPRIHQVLFAPRDLSLPLIAWAASKLEHQLHATPLLRHASDMLRFAELTRATANAARASACLLEGRDVTDLEWQMIRDSAQRLADCAMELEAKAVSMLQQRRLR